MVVLKLIRTHHYRRPSDRWLPRSRDGAVPHYRVLCHGCRTLSAAEPTHEQALATAAAAGWTAAIEGIGPDFYATRHRCPACTAALAKGA